MAKDLIIQEAEREKSLLRLALVGPSGFGKSMTALKLARGLIRYLKANDALPFGPSFPGYGKIGVIDTEFHSSNRYAVPPGGKENDRAFAFSRLDFDPPFNPEGYIRRINAFENAGYSVIIIDGLTQLWSGTGGVQDIHKELTNNKKNKGNSYTAWREAGVMLNSVVQAWNKSPCHIIGCYRARSKSEMDKTTKEVRSIGIRAESRKDSAFEWDAWGVLVKMNRVVTLTFPEKSRFESVDGQRFPSPDEAVGEMIAVELLTGAVKSGDVDTAGLDPAIVKSVNEHVRKAGVSADELVHALASRGVARVEDLTAAQAEEMMRGMRKLIRMADAEKAASIAAGANLAIDTAPAPPPPPPAPAPEPSAPPEPRYWVHNNDNSWIEPASEVQAMIDAGWDGPIMREDESEWGTASDYGFVVPDGPPEPEPAPVEDPAPSDEAAEQPEDLPATSGPWYWLAVNGSSVAMTAPRVREEVAGGYDGPIMADGDTDWGTLADHGFLPPAAPDDEPDDARPLGGSTVPYESSEKREKKRRVKEAAAQGEILAGMVAVDGEAERNRMHTRAAELAERLGYTEADFTRHVQLAGAASGDFADLDNAQMESVIDSLETMAADQYENAAAFSLDDWEVEGERLRPPPPAKQPKKGGAAAGKKK